MKIVIKKQADNRESARKITLSVLVENSSYSDNLSYLVFTVSMLYTQSILKW